MEYTNSRITYLINEYIHHKRDREIMIAHYVDGVSADEIARRRDSMGRYSRNEYSRAAGNMADRVRSLAADAPDDTTRREMERMADKMDRM